MKPVAAVGVPKWAAPRGPRIDPDTPHGVPCPHCAGDSRVVDSRPRHGTIQRRRVCDNCGRRFTTFEIVSDINPAALAKKFRKQAAEIRNLVGYMEQILSGIENPDAVIDRLEAERAKQ